MSETTEAPVVYGQPQAPDPIGAHTSRLARAKMPAEHVAKLREMWPTLPVRARKAFDRMVAQVSNDDLWFDGEPGSALSAWADQVDAGELDDDAYPVVWGQPGVELAVPAEAAEVEPPTPAQFPAPDPGAGAPDVEQGAGQDAASPGGYAPAEHTYGEVNDYIAGLPDTDEGRAERDAVLAIERLRTPKPRSSINGV